MYVPNKKISMFRMNSEKSNSQTAIYCSVLLVKRFSSTSEISIHCKTLFFSNIATNTNQRNLTWHVRFCPFQLLRIDFISFSEHCYILCQQSTVNCHQIDIKDKIKKTTGVFILAIGNLKTFL